MKDKKTGTPDERQAALIDAAIEGLTPGRGNNFGFQRKVHEESVGPGVQGEGTGSPMGGGGLGIDTSSAGPGEQPDDPSAETGGPRGAGTSISSSSGGRTGPGDTLVRDPEEAIRQSTSRPVADRERARRGSEDGEN
jgi:hypothetical protein